MDQQEIKKQLKKRLLGLVEAKKTELRNEIWSAKESRDNETKSSVGDKHETSRSLVQIEIDQLEVQLDKTLQQESELSKLPTEKIHTRVEPGSLVFTNREAYFISIGLGKIEWESQVYYCISPVSPVGKLLHGKKVGEKVQFNGQEIEVKGIG